MEVALDELKSQTYTAFLGHDLLAKGALERVVLAVKQKLKADSTASILVFSDLTGKEMDFDLRGSEKEVLGRLQVFMGSALPQEPVGPGRPKLGVVAREVSLLPRHWEWLSTQSGGASATIRRLIDEVRRDLSGKVLRKQAQERTHKFMTSIAGNFPNFEEALRALYLKDANKFSEQISPWPKDVRKHVKELAAPVFAAY